MKLINQFKDLLKETFDSSDDSILEVIIEGKKVFIGRKVAEQLLKRGEDEG